MNKGYQIKIFILLLLISGLSFYSCYHREQNIFPIETKIIPEYPVEEIQLNGKAGQRFIEASGLAWYGEFLLILPQYPHLVSERFDGALLALRKQQILDYINGINLKPLEAIEIPFIAKGLDDIGKAEGSGYEAITFNGSKVYLSIESFDDKIISSFIVSGQVYGNLDSIVINADSKKTIVSNSKLKNMGEEAIVYYINNLFCIHEANGKNVVYPPIIHKINTSSGIIENIKVPSIEYRITDATEADDTGIFWAMNYLYSGDIKKLNPAADSIANNFGVGSTNYKFDSIERIIQLQIGEDKIYMGRKEPVYLQLTSNEGRNWEGLVKLDDLGFLVISDYFPYTMFGFVRYKLD